MPAKEEWEIWTATARHVEQISLGGRSIINLAASLSNTHVAPPLNWSRKTDLEAVLCDIQEHARRVIDLAGSLKNRFCGTPTEKEG